MAISMGMRSGGGHPDHGFGGTAGAGNTAGTGVEGAYGGAAFGPDSFSGYGPPGGYSGMALDAINNMQGKREMANFLQGMSKTYGFESVKNFIDGYMGIVNAPVNPNLDAQEQQNQTINNAVRNYTNPGNPQQGFSITVPSYADQAQNVNVAPPGFGPSQGLGLGNYGNFGDQ